MNGKVITLLQIIHKLSLWNTSIGYEVETTEDTKKEVVKVFEIFYSAMTHFNKL